MLKSYIFTKAKIPASDIVKILFQQEEEDNIFCKLIDKDEDYELSLTLDTIIATVEFTQKSK